MKTAISIPDDLFQKADYVAKQRGISRSQLYVEAIKAFIAESGESVTEGLNRVYANSDSPDPVIERAALSDLPADEW